MSKFQNRLIIRIVGILVVNTITAFLLTSSAADWPMLGRDKTRNAVSAEKNPPTEWDTKTGKNIKWKARIGSYTFGAPVVANGLVWVGANNGNPRDASVKGPAGILMSI